MKCQDTGRYEISSANAPGASIWFHSLCYWSKTLKNFTQSFLLVFHLLLLVFQKSLTHFDPELVVIPGGWMKGERKESAFGIVTRRQNKKSDWGERSAEDTCMTSALLWSEGWTDATSPPTIVVVAVVSTECFEWTALTLRFTSSTILLSQSALQLPLIHPFTHTFIHQFAWFVCGEKKSFGEKKWLWLSI